LKAVPDRTALGGEARPLQGVRAAAEAQRACERAGHPGQDAAVLRAHEPETGPVLPAALLQGGRKTVIQTKLRPSGCSAQLHDTLIKGKFLQECLKSRRVQLLYLVVPEHDDAEESAREGDLLAAAQVHPLAAAAGPPAPLMRFI